MRSKSEHDTLAKSLQELVKTRLFGDRPWMAEINTPPAMKQVFMGMGLLLPRYDCEDPNDPDKIYSFDATPLGEEYDIELILLMAGIEDCWDMYVPVFVSMGFLDEIEDKTINARCLAGEDIEVLLRPFAMRAYYKYYSITLGSDDDPLKFHSVADTTRIEAPDARSLH